MKYFLTMWLIGILTLPLAAKPATQPTTQPQGLDAARVLVLPFVPVERSVEKDGIGRGVERAMEADLSRVGSLQPMTIEAGKPENEPPVGGYDSAVALRLAHAEAARYVVYGTYQIVDQELRIVAVVADVQTGRSVGGLKATGLVRDLFEMEDLLCGQARRVLCPEGVVRTVEAAKSAPGRSAKKDLGPIANPYAFAYEDPAVARSRQTLQTSIEYVYPIYGCYGGCFGYCDNYRYFGFGPVWGYGAYGYGGAYGWAGWRR